MFQVLQNSRAPPRITLGRPRPIVLVLSTVAVGEEKEASNLASPLLRRTARKSLDRTRLFKTRLLQTSAHGGAVGAGAGVAAEDADVGSPRPHRPSETRTICFPAFPISSMRSCPCNSLFL